MNPAEQTLPQPERLRTIEHPFGWLPCRMLTNGTIADMSPIERQLYLVLALAANRRGVSFYCNKRIQRTIGCTQAELDRARAALTERDLIAYDGTIYQLLSLPPEPKQTPNTPPELSQPTKMTPHTAPDTSTPVQPTTCPAVEHQQRRAMPDSVRHILRDIFGRENF